MNVVGWNEGQREGTKNGSWYRHSLSSLGVPSVVDTEGEEEGTECVADWCPKRDSLLDTRIRYQVFMVPFGFPVASDPSEGGDLSAILLSF